MIEQARQGLTVFTLALKIAWLRMPVAKLLVVALPPTFRPTYLLHRHISCLCLLVACVHHHDHHNNNPLAACACTARCPLWRATWTGSLRV